MEACLALEKYCPHQILLGVAQDDDTQNDIHKGDYVPLVVDTEGCLRCCETKEELFNCGVKTDKRGIRVCAWPTQDEEEEEK